MVKSHLPHVVDSAPRALFQAFLPPRERDQSHVWKFSLEFGGRRPIHFHSEPELNLIVSGEGTFRVGESMLEARKGDLLAFPPGQEHALLRASSDIYLFAIGMSQDLSADVLRENRQHIAAPMHLRLAPGDFESLIHRASLVVDRNNVDPLVAELWHQANWLRQRDMAQHERPMHVIVRRALSILSEHPQWNSERIACASQTQTSELSRYFHRDLSMTFVKYRSRLRLLRLIRLMDEGGQGLKSAATVAGFGSYSQCHRVFQTELGCSPSQFFQAGLRTQMQQAYELDYSAVPAVH